MTAHRELPTDDPAQVGIETSTIGLPEKPDVFISYSRKDRKRVEELLAPLRGAELDLWFDTEDIPLSADWQAEIDRGIAAAPTMVFMLSDHSLASTHCMDEVATAVEFGKRIVPVALVPTPTRDVPSALSSPNWIHAADREAADVAQDIRDTVDTDLEWAEFHTRFLERALEWVQADRDGSLVVRGLELATARIEIAAAPAAEPIVTPLQREYLAASIGARTRRRIIGSVIGAALVIVAIAAVITFTQWQRAEANERVAESLRLASDGTLLFGDQLDLALLLTLEGIATDDNQSVRSTLIRGVTAGPGFRSATTISVDELQDAAFSATGTRIAFVDTNNQAFVTTAGEPLPEEPVVELATAGAMSRDGNVAAFVTTDSVVFVDTAGLAVSRCPIGSTVPVLAIDTVGTRAAVGVRDAERGERLAVVDTNCVTAATIPVGGVTSAAFSPIDDMLAVGSATEGLSLWQVSTALPFPALPQATGLAVRSVTVDGAGGSVAAGTDDGAVFVWDTTTTSAPREMIGSHGNWVTALSFDASGDLLLSGDLNGLLRLREAASGRESGAPLTNLPPDRAVTRILDLAFTDAGSMAMSVHSEGRTLTWDLNDRSALATRPSTQIGITGIAMGGPAMAVAGAEGLEFVEPNGAPSSGSRALDEALSAIAPADGDRVVVGFRAGGVQVVDGTGSAVTARFPGPRDALDASPNSVAASPDGASLASGYDGGAVVMTTLDDGTQRVFDHGGEYVSEVRFADDGALLLSAGADRIVRVWPLDGSTEPLEFAEHGATVDALAIHPNQPLAASGSDDRSILIWDYRTGELQQRLSGHNDRVVSVAFSHDGTRLVSSSEDTTVIVWDLTTGAVIGQPLRNEFGSQSDSVVFDPADSAVVFAGGSGVFRWDLRDHVVEAVACSIVGARAFSESERDRYLDGAASRYECK